MKETLCLWTTLACFAFLMRFLHPASAEDLAVEWVTATPFLGQAGDTVNLEGRLANYGPGDNYAVQYRWYLSSDANITTGDMALGSEVVLLYPLYAGSGTIVTQTMTLHPFSDPVAPSHLGLIVDPNEFASDSNRSNNTGSAAFTFSGHPLDGFYDTVCDNYLDAVHLTAAMSAGNLVVAIAFSQPPLSTVSALTGIDLDTDRNPNTGWVTPNLAGDTTIGADYVLRSYWDYNDLKQMTHLYRTLPPESLQTVHQFTTPTHANRLYLTLPLESIGLPAGPVDILVRTASWGGGGGILIPNDDLPNSGVMTLATIPGACPWGLDPDGDADGSDLAALANNPAIKALGDFVTDFSKANCE
jgi:hypothetical protein